MSRLHLIIALAGLDFEWDETKAEANRKKHKISFKEATAVFGDVLSITMLDPDHSKAEARYITIGLSNASQLLVIAHTDRRGKIRIISARKATKNERKKYEETI